MKDEELYKKEEANSQKINIDVLPLLSNLYHRKLVVIIVTIIFAIIGVIMAFTSDRDYTASEVVVPEQEQDMKSSLMNSLSSFMDLSSVTGSDEGAYNVTIFPEMAVILGYLIVFVLLVLGYFIGLSYVYEFGISNSISNINIFVVISQLAAYIWGFANLNPVTIGSQNLFLPNLFSSSLSIDFKLCLIAFVALSALILFISGINLNNKYKTQAKKTTLIFSGFYAIFMGIVAIFTYVNVNGGSLLGYNVQMYMSVIFTIIISFIYSFVVTFLGFKLNN